MFLALAELQQGGPSKRMCRDNCLRRPKLRNNSAPHSTIILKGHDGSEAVTLIFLRKHISISKSRAPPEGRGHPNKQPSAGLAASRALERLRSWQVYSLEQQQPSHSSVGGLEALLVLA